MAYPFPVVGIGALMSETPIVVVGEMAVLALSLVGLQKVVVLGSGALGNPGFVEVVVDLAHLVLPGGITAETCLELEAVAAIVAERKAVAAPPPLRTLHWIRHLLEWVLSTCSSLLFLLLIH